MFAGPLFAQQRYFSSVRYDVSGLISNLIGADGFVESRDRESTVLDAASSATSGMDTHAVPTYALKSANISSEDIEAFFEHAYSET